MTKLVGGRRRKEGKQQILDLSQIKKKKRLTEFCKK